MKLTGIHSLLLICLSFTAQYSAAESMRCHNDIVQIGDTKADIIQKCGNPEMTDSYCEKLPQQVPRADGTTLIVDSCENIDIWTYNPGKGQFWTHLYFAKGKLREMKYGDRVE